MQYITSGPPSGNNTHSIFKVICSRFQICDGFLGAKGLLSFTPSKVFKAGCGCAGQVNLASHVLVTAGPDQPPLARKFPRYQLHWCQMPELRLRASV